MNRPLFMQKSPEFLQASAIWGLSPAIAIHRATASVHVMANVGAIVDARQGKIARSKRKMSPSSSSNLPARRSDHSLLRY